MQVDSGESYHIKPRTMEVREDELFVQVESPVDFASLIHHKVDLSNYHIHHTSANQGYKTCFFEI